METKTKLKGIMVLAFAILFGINANAQQAVTLPESAKGYDQNWRLGFGINGGYAFEDPYGATLGVDARIQYDLSKRTSVTLTSGYTHFFLDGDLDDMGVVPVKAGFKGFIYGDSFYLMGEVGAAFQVTKDYNDTSLLVAPSIGYATKYIDWSLRYEYYPDFLKASGDKGVGQIALRVAYGFKL
ncbi:MAG: hypothetical protein PSV16_09380 [Flavobacterium sp.]|nr:hypothetical protein [Flavobacterium sp.]